MRRFPRHYFRRFLKIKLTVLGILRANIVTWSCCSNVHTRVRTLSIPVYKRLFQQTIDGEGQDSTKKWPDTKILTERGSPDNNYQPLSFFTSLTSSSKFQLHKCLRVSGATGSAVGIFTSSLFKIPRKSRSIQCVVLIRVPELL